MITAVSNSPKALNIILINLFVISIFASSITGSAPYFYPINITLTVLLLITISLHSRAVNFSFSEFFTKRKLTRFFLPVISLIVLPAITLTYSSNFEYGLKKITDFLIITLPVLFTAGYLALTYREEYWRIFYHTIGTYAVFSVVLILVLTPFSYDGSTLKSISDWSHVIYGRFISLTFIIYFIHLTGENEEDLFPGVVILAITALGVFLSGLRAGTLGLMIFLPAIIIYRLVKSPDKILRIFLIIIFIGGAYLLSYLVPSNEQINERYSDAVDVENFRFGADEAILSRIHAWEECLMIIKENPITGTGYGGFNNYKNIEITRNVKYPHNLVLEFVTEMGLFGAMLLIYLLYIIFRNTYRLMPELAIIFLFALWLTMFSKNLPSQAILWIGIAAGLIYKRSE